jgi:hypothetical protein
MHLRIDIELRGELLLVTANGRVKVDTASRLLKRVCDTAAEKQVNKILVNCLAVTGELFPFERYRLGVETAEVYLTQPEMNVRLAFVGKLPTTDGFGVRVARNRGLVTQLFATPEEALRWLEESPAVPAEDAFPQE